MDLASSATPQSKNFDIEHAVSQEVTAFVPLIPPQAYQDDAKQAEALRLYSQVSNSQASIVSQRFENDVADFLISVPPKQREGFVKETYLEIVKEVLSESQSEDRTNPPPPPSGKADANGNKNTRNEKM